MVELSALVLAANAPFDPIRLAAHPPRLPDSAPASDTWVD